MLLKPDLQIKKITDLNYDILKKNNIKGLILDVDNTLIDLDKKPLEGIVHWITELKEKGIKICIASNSIKKKKVENVANMLNVPYVYFSIKPTKKGLKKAKKILDMEEKYIAEIGDQLFTDVLGANRMKMFSILTQPICDEKVKLNNIKRKIEKNILMKIEKKNKGGN